MGRIASEEADWLSRATMLNIDHHVSSNYFGDLNLVDPKAAATCEVVARVVDALEIELDEELATALMVGIVRDSQGFSDTATSGDTLRTAARLVDAGAPLAVIHRRILSELPFATIALWGKMLAGVGSDADDRIVHTMLMLSMLDETGTQQHDADGLAEFLAKAKGADVTLLLRELGPDETRVVSARRRQSTRLPHVPLRRRRPRAWRLQRPSPRHRGLGWSWTPAGMPWPRRLIRLLTARASMVCHDCADRQHWRHAQPVPRTGVAGGMRTDPGHRDARPPAPRPLAARRALALAR